MGQSGIPNTPGDNLTPRQRSLALAGFVHRFTGDHKPHWASKPMPNGSPYPVQFASDTDWLRNTLFYCKRDGTLGVECRSSPTWPNNPELRK